MAPTDLVQLAASCGIRTLALTDHDTIDGIAPALAAAALIPPQDGFALIPGVEISASYRAGASGLLKEIHILGYFRPDGYESIAPFIGMMKRERNARNYKIIAKLNALGMRITVGDAEEEAKKAVFGRPHIAAALVRKGYADDINGAFERYLALGKKAYAPKEYPTPAQCAAAISEAGGVAAIAHPVRSGMRLRELRAMIESLLPHGLAGIEAYYTDNTPQDTANCIAVAKAFGLVMTGGSDFHGEYKKNIRLGVGKGNLRVPDALPDMLLERLRAGGARRPTR
jgi:predicted metal-dependent phosphoesterase TrpH